MSPRHIPRRKSYMQNIPRNVGIPKFLRPEEILKVQRMKEESPDIPWVDVVNRVVFESVGAVSVLR